MLVFWCAGHSQGGGASLGVVRAGTRRRRAVSGVQGTARGCRGTARGQAGSGVQGTAASLIQRATRFGGGGALTWAARVEGSLAGLGRQEQQLLASLVWHSFPAMAAVTLNEFSLDPPASKTNFSRVTGRRENWRDPSRSGHLPKPLGRLQPCALCTVVAHNPLIIRMILRGDPTESEHPV